MLATLAAVCVGAPVYVYCVWIKHIFFFTFAIVDICVRWTNGVGCSQANSESILYTRLYVHICVLHVNVLVTFSPLFPCQANRVDVLFCIKLKGMFDPRQGFDIIHFFMKWFAKLILHPLVRPFVLLFFGLTSTASLAMLFRVKIGLEETLALPKVCATIIGNGRQIWWSMTIYTYCTFLGLVLDAIL